jgi:hypothetical protein
MSSIGCGAISVAGTVDVLCSLPKDTERVPRGVAVCLCITDPQQVCRANDSAVEIDDRETRRDLHLSQDQ